MTTFFSVYETIDPTLDTFRHIGTYRSFAEAIEIADKNIPPEYEKEVFFQGHFFTKIRAIDNDNTIVKKVYIRKTIIA